MTNTPDLALTPAAIRRRQLKVLLGVGTAAVVVAGIGTQLLLHRSPEPAAPALAPSTAFSILAAEQQPADHLDVPDVQYAVDPSTTRFLAENAQGKHYLGISPTDLVCLYTLDETLSAGCTQMPSSTDRVVLTSEGPRDADLELVPDGYVPREGWTAIGPNLLVRSS